jgi:DNA repair protein RadC
VPIRTVSWRFSEASETYPNLETLKSMKFTSPDDIFWVFRFLFDDEVRERFVVFWLDSASQVLGFEVVSEGTLTSTVTHPREIFRGAIVATCSSIIVAHNHPSGNTEPSAEDVALTKQLVKGGRIIGIPLSDHIIFARDQYTSFAERDLL